MKALQAFLLVSALSGSVWLRSHAADALATQCWTPLETSESLVSHLQEIVTATNPEGSALRDSLRLPATPAASVQVVTTDSICGIALTEHSAIRQPPVGTILTRLLVVRVGSTRYVVWDGFSRAGEFDLFYIYDQNFQFLAALAG